jgi:hypothetical protein
MAISDLLATNNLRIRIAPIPSFQRSYGACDMLNPVADSSRVNRNVPTAYHEYNLYNAVARGNA